MAYVMSLYCCVYFFLPLQAARRLSVQWVRQINNGLLIGPADRLAHRHTAPHFGSQSDSISGWSVSPAWRGASAAYAHTLSASRHCLAERRQVHHVLIAPCRHKRQVGVVQVAARIRVVMLALPIIIPCGAPSTCR